MHPVLTGTTDQGETITLRLPETRDVEQIVAACTDPLSLQWTTLPEGFDLERAHGFVARASRLWDEGLGARWIIAGPDDACVGLFDLHVYPHDPAAGEVFFVAAPAARGRGFMTAALRTAAHWAIRERGLARVEWQALVGNEGSRRVAEKAGFQFEGILRLRCDQRGKRYDSWVSSITRDDLV